MTDESGVVVRASFDTGLRARIVAAIRDEAPGDGIVVSEESWQRLSDILARYIGDRNYWKGFLTKSEARPLAEVAKKAKQLHSALIGARERELVWYLESEFPEGALERLEEDVGRLATMMPRSPRIPEFDDKGLERPALLRDHSAIDLQSELDAWWKGHTGRRGIVDGDTPYRLFLELAFSLIPEDIAPGVSFDPVKRRRASVNGKRRWLREVAAKLEHLRNPKGGNQ